MNNILDKLIKGETINSNDCKMEIDELELCNEGSKYKNLVRKIEISKLKQEKD